MNENELKKCVSEAETAVADVKDAALRTKAFEMVLAKLLAKGGSIQQVSQSAKSTITGGEQGHMINIADIATLARESRIEEDDLKRVVDFTGKSFRLLGNVPGESDSEKQRNAVMMILTVRYHCLGSREAQAKELRESLRILGIASLPNLATNLSKAKTFILREGGYKSPTTSYRITDPGLREGYRLIRDAAMRDREGAIQE